MHWHLHYRGPRRRGGKGPEKIFEEIIAENFPNMENIIINQDIINLAQRDPGRINQEATHQVT